MTKESDHTANLRKAREQFVEDRRQLAADLAKPFKRGDEKKRELFTAIQSAIDAIDRAIEDERSNTEQSNIAEVLANSPLPTALDSR